MSVVNVNIFNLRVLCFLLFMTIAMECRIKADIVVFQTIFVCTHFEINVGF